MAALPWLKHSPLLEYQWSVATFSPAAMHVYRPAEHLMSIQISEFSAECISSFSSSLKETRLHQLDKAT